MATRLSARSAAHIRRAVIEQLETRRLLAIVVNTTADEIAANSTTSLREALAQAAANAGDDIITFDPAVFTFGSAHRIQLAHGALQIASGGGKIIIDGPSRDTVVIDAAGNSRVFEI